MAAVAKFVQPIPIFLAYLVPLDVDAALGGLKNSKWRPLAWPPNTKIL
jgi:hypothetical protein